MMTRYDHDYSEVQVRGGRLEPHEKSQVGIIEIVDFNVKVIALVQTLP